MTFALPLLLALIPLAAAALAWRFRVRAAPTPALRTADSPTQRVGGAVLDGFTPVRHAVPMLSIRTETDTEPTGAVAFDARVRRELGLAEDAEIGRAHV